MADFEVSSKVTVSIKGTVFEMTRGEAQQLLAALQMELGGISVQRTWDWTKTIGDGRLPNIVPYHSSGDPLLHPNTITC